MRLRLIIFLMLLTLIGLTFPDSPSFADQMTNTQWFYAFNVDNGQIVTYTPQGQLNVLLQPETGLYDVIPYVDFPDVGALVQITFGNRVQDFYFLTPTIAYRPDIADNNSWSPVIQTDRYAVLIGTSAYSSTPAVILFDSVTQTVISLPYLKRVETDIFRFSAGGAYLRYIRQGYYVEPTLVMERHLATGLERQIWSSEQGDQIGVWQFPTPDEFGDRWLWGFRESDSDRQVTALLRVDGNSDILSEAPRYAPSPFIMHNGQLIERPPDCATTCTLTVYPVSGDPITVQAVNLDVDSLEILDESSVLASRADHYWLLTTDNPPQYLGYVTDVYHNSVFDTRSPDGRWLTLHSTETNPQSIVIWDLMNHSLAASFQRDNGGEIRLEYLSYYPNGLVFRTQHPRHTLWFDYATGVMTDLPHFEDQGRHYYELLPDNTFLLHTATFSETGQHDEFFHYDPVTDVHTFLFEGNWRLLNFPDLEQSVHAND